jgi:SAM-dependent methyltransferase
MDVAESGGCRDDGSPDRAMRTLLRRFHARPGQTPLWLAPWRTREGRTSYEVLVEETAALPRESRLLDVACGDGTLLHLLSQAGIGDVVGVDQSPEELARARAEALPPLPLPDRSVDMAVCHMALMVIEPVEPVLAEIARVLRPGGRFVAVVNRYVVDPVNEVYRKWLHRTRAEAGLPRLRVGDPRAYTAEGLAELIGSQAFDARSLVIRDVDLHTRATPEALWASLRLLYDVFDLPEEVQARVERRVLRAWEPHVDEEGMLSCAMGIRKITCCAPPSAGSRQEEGR